MYSSLLVKVLDTVLAPSSPNPLCSKVDILNIVSSSICVFIWLLRSNSSSLLGGTGFFRGFSASYWMIWTIFWMGLITICSVSLAKIRLATVSTKQVNNVVEN